MRNSPNSLYLSGIRLELRASFISRVSDILNTLKALQAYRFYRYT
ncbi:hypothetical protein [Rubritalea tangerina]